ncbi:MAG: tRNA adenosine(34) deaminase TadA [Planctomycetota bacterium]
MFNPCRRDEHFMALALQEAEIAAKNEEVPVGVVFVSGDKVIARACNQCEMLKDPTAHAELIGLTQACAKMGVQRLVDVEVFVTKEPCVMCAGALVHARISRLVVGAPDSKAGACGSVLDIVHHPRLNHQIPTVFGILDADCRALLQDFFRSRRHKGDDNSV